MLDAGMLYEIATEHQNWATCEPVTITLLARLIVGLPGGSDLEDAGYKTFGNIDWREIDFLARVLSALETAGDVEQVAQAILH